MPASTTVPDVALLRLAAQRLAGPGSATATDTVRWMTAIQAQDYRGALTSVGLRTANGSRRIVEAALDAGEIVRSWPMRGTLHLVVAEDLLWMLQLTSARTIAGAAARRAQLQLDPSTLARAEELAVHALSGGRRLRRTDLLAVWEQGGVATEGQRGYHLLGHLAQTGTLCFGPVHDGQQVIILVHEWVTQPRRLEREEALGELAVRYFRSHGPATVKDFSRWTGLLAADVRTGLALARPTLASLDVGGIEHLMDPQTPELLDSWRAGVSGVHLLPGFDEFMLGYGDRSAALHADFAERIVPGRNGVFRPTVISGGQVVGTWKHSGPVAAQTVAATPFLAFSTQVAEGITQAYAALR